MVRAIILILIAVTVQAQPNLSYDNIRTVPVWERYEFQGSSTKHDRLPVVIEYSRFGDSLWETKGTMTIGKNRIDERYRIRTDNLLITEYWRDLSYPRGVTKNHSRIVADTRTEDPAEFIVGTIPGLLYILRTYPFDKSVDKIMVRAPSQEKGHLNFQIKNRGLRRMNIPAFGEIEVYHLEVSLVIPVVSGVLPKLNYYFRNDAAKTLVAMKGLMPGTGSKIDIVLKKYSSR